MIVVQMQIEVTDERIATPIFVLAREDASDHEQTIAHAAEQWLIALNEQVFAASGAPLEVQLIGPQHEEERTALALIKAALALDSALLPADTPGVVAFHLSPPERAALADAATAYRAARHGPPEDVHAG